ncbi:MAG: hypothetical protein Q9159_002049 [Coniocarpon cinnabarinum]
MVEELDRLDFFTVGKIVILITSATSAFTKAFTIPRHASLPLILLIVTSLITTLNRERSLRPAWASALSVTSLVSLFQHVDLVILTPRKRSRDDIRTLKSDSNRLGLGLRQTTSLRHVGTSEQVKNVPSFSSKHPDYVPSRGAFLLQLALRTALCMLIVDAADTFAPSSEDVALNFSTENIPLLNNLGQASGRALAVRCGATVGFFVAVYCTANLTFDLLALIAVGLNWSRPEEWPPFFNSLSEAQSVRLFWGKFWHQNLRRPLSSSASFLTQDVLCLPDGSLTSRYAHLLIVFSLSGLIHMIAQVSSGIPISAAAGVLQFFFTQGLGIVVEDAAIAAYRWHVMSEQQAQQSKLLTVMEIVVGYAWVLFFLTWSTPVWFYNVAAYAIGQPVLPFGIVAKVL